VNAAELFPFRVCASLPSRSDRRERLIPQLAEVGLPARWIKPVPIAAIRNNRGFRNERKRSCALTKRLAIRLAQRAGAPSLLYFEDDLVFHPHFLDRLAAITLPDDWGIFYFGCLHCEQPDPVTPGLVRVRRAFDFHACAIRASHYLAARRVMRGSHRGASPTFHCDVLFSALHKTIPTYAAFPNLVWQAVGHSDLTGSRYSNYNPDGSQRPFRHAVRAMEPVAV
jgi:hypothetical protein